MISLGSIKAMFTRLTPREKRLFAILVGIFIGLLIVLVFILVHSVFGGLMEEIEHGKKVLSEAKMIAPKYLELSAVKKQIEEAIRNNKATSVRVAANEILKKLELSETIPGVTGNLLSDIVSFEGKTNEIPIETPKGGKKPPKPKGKEEGPILVEVEQVLEFREIPHRDLFKFLDAVQTGKDLLFVTKLDITRKFNNLNNVRAVITIATFQYKGEVTPQVSPTESTPR